MRRCATSTSAASTSSSIPSSEIIPAIGAKEAIFNLNLAFLDPGDYALAADPGYPVYTGGPWLAGAEPVLMALEPEHGFVPDLGAIDEDVARRAKLMFLNYPNNPTGAVVPEGFFERVVEFARAYEILVVHDNAYSEIVFDGYRAPSFLATPGAKEVGIEVFSLSKGYNMTGWRCAVVVGNAEALETYWRLKTNIDSGLFEAVQLAGVAALSPDADAEVASMNELYRRRRDLVCDALRRIGVNVRPPHGTIYVWAPVPDGFDGSEAYCEHVLERTGVVLSPGAVYGPAGEGWFRISLTTPDERLLEAVERLGQRSADGPARRPTELPRHCERGRHGVHRQSSRQRPQRRTSQPERGRAGASARASARSASRRCPRARTSPSWASCCAPPASRSSGEMVQRREQPHPNTYLGPGKVAEAKAAAAACDANVIACDDELTRAPGAQPRGGARAAGGRPHDRDPRHLRLARRQRRGQAAGRAGPARVQPRAHARAVEPPRAPRRRHRHEGPGGDADRDRPPAGARPDRGAAPAPRAREGHARRAARRARARGAADDRAGRLHQRRQVDAAERA